MKKLFDRLLVRESYTNNLFVDYITNKNVRRSKVFAVVIMLVEALMIMFTFIKVDLFDAKHLVTLRMHYVILFVVTAILYFTLIFFDKKNEINAKTMHFIFGFLLSFGLSWGASVSLIDVSLTGSISVYLTFVFMVSIAVLHRPDVYLSSYLVVHAIFLIVLPQYQLNSSAVYINQLNSTIFVVFAWFVSRHQYLNEYKKYKKDLIIEEKTRMLEKKNSELVKISMVDSLTGMYNRRTLDVVLSKLWSEAYVNRLPVTIFMLDIDKFKQLNDTYGHIAGDECLVKVCKSLMELTRKYNGHAFRYGGDEFCLVFDDIDDSQIVKENIVDCMKNLEFKVKGHIKSIRLSVGVSHRIPEGKHSFWTCVEDADHNLYENKKKRKQRISDEY